MARAIYGFKEGFKMKVLVYGSINIDLSFYLDHLVKEGETISSNAFIKGAGGKGANQASALGKAFGEKGLVYLAGKTGKDASFILEKLNENNVDTAFVYNSLYSGQAIIEIDKEGQNSIILYGGGNKEIEKKEIDEVFSYFNKGDYLVLNGEINNLDYIYDLGLKKEMKIVVNPSPLTEEILSLPLEKATVIILNEVEASSITRLNVDDEKSIVSSLRERFPNSEVVLTLGDKGSYYCFKQETIYQPIFKVDAVDCVGAGDTFLGYFLASRIKGLDAKTSLEKASFASSITVQRHGAMDAMPKSIEVFA